MSGTVQASRAAPAGATPARMHVPRWMDRISGHIERHPRLWTRLGRWESALLRDRLEDVPLERPVYVSGLARSGTTILLEILARHPEVSTHRYRDYPAVFTPWFWNRFLDGAVKGTEAARERAHGDRIRVTPESPEAFEEPLWMAFFPEAHEPARSAVLDEHVRRPEFEAFYRDHVRKLLLVRGGRRYVAKGNYNLTRLRYLRRVVPDARFVVPVREPAAHVASLVRQHERFAAEGARDDRIRRHLRRSGHFEFGLDRRAVHTGDDQGAEEVRALWAEGHEVEGWAAYWALVYRYVHETLAADPDLRRATLVLRYEDLCARPEETVEGLLEHCALPPGELPRRARETVSAPDYYRSPFDERDLRLLDRRTRSVARLFGYGD